MSFTKSSEDVTMTSHQDHDGRMGEPQTEINVNVNLQDIIRVRKAERRLKTEEKRQADLDRIRDMRSTTGIDPLQRFPKEIWSMIFAELDPKDLANVWEVHPLFRDLLEKARVRDILLPQILNLIQTKYERYIRSDFRRYHYFEQFRRVCRITRKSFDRRMDNILIKQIYDNTSPCWSSPFCHGNSEMVRFDVTEERELAKRMLTSFGGDESESSSKRFFPRALYVSVSDSDIEEGVDVPQLLNQFKSDITALLERIGHQIWYFNFSLDSLESFTLSFSEVYIMLQGWISSMPNLKWLEVSILPPFQIIDDVEGGEEITAALYALEKYPFPCLTHLERLSFLQSSYEEMKTGIFRNIHGAILAANQHIKMLDLSDGDVNDYADDFKLPLMPTHRTQSLQLTKFTLDTVNRTSGDGKSSFAWIRPIINYNWKLQSIFLSLTTSESDEGTNESESIVSVFRLLQHFPTLESVKLHRMENFIVRDTHKIGYLKLPNLTEFELDLDAPKIDYESNIHFFFSLQFLVHSAKLKRLSWKLSDYNDGKLPGHLKKLEIQNFEKMVDFRGGFRYLYDANLWHVFPSLVAIVVALRKDRSAYDNSCKQEYLRADIEDMSIRRFWKIHQYKRASFKYCLL